MTQHKTEDLLSFRLITFNVRYATRTPVRGEEPWAVRCPKLCAQLRFITAGHASAFICLQEVLHSQLVDIASNLGPNWGHIGKGRDDGRAAGEYSPIFYRADQWTVEQAKTWWLSPTPDVPSRGWDAALNRIVTVGSFRHCATGARFIVMSTHFDHLGEEAREQSAKLILKIANGATAAKPVPLFLGGDFNSTPESRAYRAITAPGSGMADISSLVPETSKYGNKLFTYTSFGEPGETPSRLDFLFAYRPVGIRFLTYGVLANRFDDDVYLSDHRPVVADLEVPVASC